MLANSPELLTVVEAADIVRLKPSTIRAWILHRKIAYVKLGGRVFLRRSDVEGLIEQGLIPEVTACQGDNDPDFRYRSYLARWGAGPCRAGGA